MDVHVAQLGKAPCMARVRRVHAPACGRVTSACARLHACAGLKEIAMDNQRGVRLLSSNSTVAPVSFLDYVFKQNITDPDWVRPAAASCPPPFPFMRRAATPGLSLASALPARTSVAETPCA